MVPIRPFLNFLAAIPEWKSDGINIGYSDDRVYASLNFTAGLMVFTIKDRNIGLEYRGVYEGHRLSGSTETPSGSVLRLRDRQAYLIREDSLDDERMRTEGSSEDAIMAFVLKYS
jgi:hypothetical protein